MNANWIVVPASSGTLSRQIEAGAEADLFISANPQWMQHLEMKGYVRRDSTILLSNRLVIAAPAQSDWTCQLPCPGLREKLNGRPFAICDPAHAPCGQYAEQSLKATGLWEQIDNRLIRGASAQLTLNWIALGEAGAGVVYLSDALSTGNVRMVMLLPEESHSPIRYLLARLGKDPAAIEAESVLKSSRAAEIFREFGFQPLPPRGTVQ